MKKIKENKKDWRNSLIDLEKKIDKFVDEKLPKLPKSVGEFLVKYGPYLMVFVLISFIPFILATLGLNALIPIAFLGRKGIYHFSFWNVFALISIIIQIIALPGLFKRKIMGWRWLFYASLVTALSYLINFQLGNLIIGTGISWYFLFQIRKYYK